ncbi:MAG: hypothetical protein JNK57_03405 [Planctomycetaceae bacterium]|jgi:hypothetical protein|nr:hypothetical protein [Planctomycetaceae bacterium]
MNKLISRVSHTGEAGKSTTMSEQISPEPKKSSETKDRMVLFCEQCYRYDKHIAVKVSLVIKILLVVLTLGLALIFWPKRCSCCGSIRF